MDQSPIAYQKPGSLRLILLFVLSVGLHGSVAMLVVWAGNHLRYQPKEEEMLDLGMDVQLGEEVQELIVAQNEPTPEPPAPEPTPPEPPPEPPTPEPEPEPEPEPMEKPEFVEPPPAPKATPAPQPKAPPTKRVPAPPGAKVGPTPRAGVVGGNVTQGATQGTPGGQKVGTQGWRTPRPPYPPAALVSRIQGSGTVRITTDGSGNVSQIAVTKPIHPLLDANTKTFARANWKGPPNTTRTVPVIYQIR